MELVFTWCLLQPGHSGVFNPHQHKNWVGWWILSSHSLYYFWILVCMRQSDDALPRKKKKSLGRERLFLGIEGQLLAAQMGSFWGCVFLSFWDTVCCTITTIDTDEGKGKEAIRSCRGLWRHWRKGEIANV